MEEEEDLEEEEARREERERPAEPAVGAALPAIAPTAEVDAGERSESAASYVRARANSYLCWIKTCVFVCKVVVLGRAPFCTHTEV